MSIHKLSTLLCIMALLHPFEVFADTPKQTLPNHVLDALNAAHESGNNYVLEAVKLKAAQENPAYLARIKAWVPAPNKPTKTTIAEVEPDNVKKWWQPKEGEVEATANLSFGNSEEKEYFLSTELIHEWGEYSNKFRFESQNSQEQGIRTEEEYTLLNQTRHNVSKRNYNYLELEFEKDRFSGIQHRISEFLGRGHIFKNDDIYKWEGELAGGFTQTVFTDGTETNSPSARLASKFRWNITPALKFRNVSRTTVSAEQVFSEVNTSIETKLYKALSLRAAVDIDHNKEVPENTENTDIETRVGIVYGF